MKSIHDVDGSERARPNKECKLLMGYATEFLSPFLISVYSSEDVPVMLQDPKLFLDDMPIELHVHRNGMPCQSDKKDVHRLHPAQKINSFQLFNIMRTYDMSQVETQDQNGEFLVSFPDEILTSCVRFCRKKGPNYLENHL